MQRKVIKCQNCSESRSIRDQNWLSNFIIVAMGEQKMATLHVREVATNFTQTLSEKRKDPYACKYVPKPNLVLVKRANQYINRNIAENGAKMEKSVENDNTDLALSTILFTPRRI